MKAYTDLEQSKKLAEFLPLESADMYWLNRHIDLTETKYEVFVIDKSNKYVDFFKSYAVAIDNNEIIPCWSLAALLEQIPSDLGSSTLTIEKCDSEPFKYGLNYHDRWGREDDIQTKYYDDLVDACYEMILKLYELNLL